MLILTLLRIIFGPNNVKSTCSVQFTVIAECQVLHLQLLFKFYTMGFSTPLVLI